MILILVIERLRVSWIGRKLGAATFESREYEEQEQPYLIPPSMREAVDAIPAVTNGTTRTTCKHGLLTGVIAHCRRDEGNGDLTTTVGWPHLRRSRAAESPESTLQGNGDLRIQWLP